ncbi:hypothetical protein Q7P36_004252 [Cladosporium allicinum]
MKQDFQRKLRTHQTKAANFIPPHTCRDSVTRSRSFNCERGVANPWQSGRDQAPLEHEHSTLSIVSTGNLENHSPATISLTALMLAPVDLVNSNCPRKLGKCSPQSASKHMRRHAAILPSPSPRNLVCELAHDVSTTQPHRARHPHHMTLHDTTRVPELSDPGKNLRHAGQNSPIRSPGV